MCFDISNLMTLVGASCVIMNKFATFTAFEAH